MRLIALEFGVHTSFPLPLENHIRVLGILSLILHVIQANTRIYHHNPVVDE